MLSKDRIQYKFVDIIYYYIKGIISLHKEIKIRKDKKSKKNYIYAEFIRDIHSIEKGLAIESPRHGFGILKIKRIMERIEFIRNIDSDYSKELCLMALDVLSEYVQFHKLNGYFDDYIKEIEIFISKNYIEHLGKYGGTKTLNKKDLKFNIADIEKFFMTRHSIRDFEKTNISNDLILKAIKLAQYAPSACNRQAVRVYVINEEISKDLSKDLKGIGGFADNVNKYILITAKTSYYRLNEERQYIVSASIYAAYLTLTLHLYGIGSCMIQQGLTWSKKWEDMKNLYGIDNDEQIICLLAIGNLKETFKVAFSHRLDTNNIVKFIQ